MARLDPPARASLPKEVDELLTVASSSDGEPLGTVAVLAHRPQLLAPFLGWAAALALEGTLSARHHETLALRTAALCESPFEWDEHVGYAHRAGLTDEDIARIRNGTGHDPITSLLIRVADSLVAHHALGDALWAELAAHFDAAALVEILYVVGQYTMLSMVANGIDLR